MGANIIEEIIRDVAELGDRESPEDQPEMMLVSAEELREILEERISDMEPDDAWISAIANTLGVSHPTARENIRLVLGAMPKGNVA